MKRHTLAHMAYTRFAQNRVRKHLNQLATTPQGPWNWQREHFDWIHMR